MSGPEPLVGELQAQVKGTVMAPFVEGFADKLSRWNLNHSKWFRFAVLAADVDDISTAVKFAKTHNIPLTTYGGGHSLAGGSSLENGLVVDLRNMRKVTVDADRKLLFVQGGALWSDVDIASMKHGLATVAGTVSHTGVGGLTLYGGYGWLSGEHGLAVDNLVGATVVLADGTIVKTSATEHPDLFWAIRGGGANFGVVSEFVFQAHPQKKEVYGGTIVFSENQVDEFTKTLDNWLETRGTDEAAFAVVKRFPEMMADFIPTGGLSLKDQSVIFFVVFYNGSADEGRKKFKSFFDMKPLVDLTHEMRYIELNSSMNAGAPHGLRRHFNPVAFKKLSAETLKTVIDKNNKFFRENPSAKDAEENSAIMFEFLHAGKIAKVAPDATAFPYREIAYNACAAMTYLNEKLADDVKAFATDIGDTVTASQGWKEPEYIYPNYGDGSHSSELIYGRNLPRLKEVKKAYDPENKFQGPYPITI